MAFKQAFIDVETTGTDPQKHAIIQLAMILVIDGAEVHRQTLYMRPFGGDVIEQGALDVNGITREQIAGFQHPADALHLFQESLAKHVDKYDKSDKCHFIGYNALFDAQFVRRWFEKCGDKYFGSWFWFPIIDVAVLVGAALAHKRHELQDFKLTTVCDHLGIKAEGSAHDAAYDIEVTRKLYELVTIAK